MVNYERICFTYQSKIKETDHPRFYISTDEIAWDNITGLKQINLLCSDFIHTFAVSRMLNKKKNFWPDLKKNYLSHHAKVTFYIFSGWLTNNAFEKPIKWLKLIATSDIFVFK